MKLLEEVRGHMRARHLAIRTEKAYLRWIERFLRFEKERRGGWVHPSLMGTDEVYRYLTHLAVEDNVSASTQTQALSALLLLFRDALKTEISFDAIRAKHPETLPVVLSIP